ncbi:hypothetical protein RH749_001733 [Campylobacter upsaliensis]|nr:hypothetical protein [Campylobacter upsaliensis]
MQFSWKVNLKAKQIQSKTGLFALAKRDGLGFRFVTLAELCFAVKVN